MIILSSRTDRRNFFDQCVEGNDIKAYEYIKKIATGRDDCTTGCSLGHPYFMNNYKLIAIDLSK